MQTRKGHKLIFYVKKLCITSINSVAIPEKYFYYDKDKDRIEIGLWILVKISAELKKIGFNCYMVEEYPTADRLEVERTPIPF